MANILATATGNWSAGGTWVGGNPPSSGDTAVANGKTVTIDQNVTCVQICNDTTGSATAGGGFILDNGVTVTANIVGSTANCMTLSGTNSATVSGAISSATNSIYCLLNSGSGTLTVIGSTSSSTGNGYSVGNNSTGSIVFTGTVNGSTGGGNAHGIYNSSSGSVTVTGNVVGSVGCGIINGTGPVMVTGNVSGGTSTGAGIANTSGNVTVVGTCTAGMGSNAITSASTSAVVLVSGSLICASNGMAALYVIKYRMSPLPTGVKTRYALNGASTYVDMFTADSANSTGFVMPAITDVRNGVAYAGTASIGGSGLTGTAYIPAAASVAYGVNVDATTGTACLTPAQVQAAILPLL